MIKIENINVFGWEPTIRGMRNPMNSWEKSDSCECSIEEMEYSKCLTSCTESEIPEKCINCKGVYLGKNDLQLMRTLSKAGTDHSKFLRMIVVTMDITAPLYWWKEFDTYKVGTVVNSCSTMHKITAKEFDVNDFSHEHIEELNGDEYNMSYDWLLRTVDILNYYRKKYNTDSEKLKRDITDAERKHVLAQQKLFWWQIIQLLPSSYNQKRTIQLNYQVLKNMYFARKNHKLDEWRTFREEIEKLPYFKEICIEPME